MTSVARKHSSIRGSFIVLNTLLSKKTAIAGLAAVAVLGGGVAFAYPAGTDLTVSASATQTDGVTSVMVSVGNANPTCATRIQIDSGNEVVLPAGTTTTTVPFGSVNGSHSVSARTVDCAKGEKEHAKSQFVVLNAQASGATTAKVKKSYAVNLSGFQPGSNVTVTATLVGSNPLVQVLDTDVADKRGTAKTKFKFTATGDWSVVTTATGGVTAASYTVTVTN
jgi:hypothetical protein